MRRVLPALVLAVLLGASGHAAPLTILVDPSRLGLLEARQAAVLEPEGYEVTYLLRPPQEQQFTLACWVCLEAEFVDVGLTLVGADMVEARMRRPTDAAALVIRTGGAAAFWDVSLGSERVPPPPAPESLEVTRAAERWRLEVAPDHLAITWEIFGESANRTTVLRLGVDGWWEGTVETVTFPGGSRDLQPLAHDGAREVLRAGLQELRRARDRFALGLGRDLSPYRLP